MLSRFTDLLGSAGLGRLVLFDRPVTTSVLDFRFVIILDYHLVESVCCVAALSVYGAIPCTQIVQ